jgi:uncharacterized membrane protein
LVGRLGEQRYLSFYSGLTVAALACLIVAYLRAPAHVLWMMPGWTAALLVPVALVGSVLVAAGLSTPNPVIVRWCSHRQAVPLLSHCSTVSWLLGGLALIVASNWFDRDAKLATGIFVGGLYLYGALANPLGDAPS